MQPVASISEPSYLMSTVATPIPGAVASVLSSTVTWSLAATSADSMMRLETAASVFVDHWRNSGKAALSGVSFQLPDGHELVIYNDAHPLTRIRATLMEEFFHIWLQHPRSVLRVMETAGPQRTIDQTVEYEAYSSGAAALVPYKPLKTLLLKTQSLLVIGQRFRVSPALVRYRANVTRLAKHIR